MKNIEELKSWFEDDKLYVGEYVKHKINQLDEPEVLSQKWISENVEYAYFDMLDGSGRLSSATAIIKPKKLQNLLVPKQELPVIPKFVADYINRKKKGGNSLDGAFAYIKAYGWDDESSYDYEVYKWLDIGSNDETFARAWLDGYTVEKEQEYVVELLYGVLAYHQLDDCWDVFDTGEIEGNEEWLYQFTEQEIKDYDERFWPFAVKIEELEE